MVQLFREPIKRKLPAGYQSAFPISVVPKGRQSRAVGAPATTGGSTTTSRHATGEGDGVPLVRLVPERRHERIGCARVRSRLVDLESRVVRLRPLLPVDGIFIEGDLIRVGRRRGRVARLRPVPVHRERIARVWVRPRFPVDRRRIEVPVPGLDRHVLIDRKSRSAGVIAGGQGVLDDWLVRRVTAEIAYLGY